MMKIIDKLIFMGNCVVAVTAFVYAISGDTNLHILCGGMSGMNLAAAILIIKEN